MPKEKKSVKIVFSEEVDSRINGLSIGLTFVIVGLFLLFVPNYFGNKLAGQIIRWIFICIGLFGLFCEFRQMKPMSNIKGFEDLWIGVSFFAIWAALFYLTHNLFCNIAGFFFLILGVYGTFHGLFLIIYSVLLNKKNETKTKGTIVSDVLIFLTKVASLALVVLQLVKAFQQ